MGEHSDSTYPRIYIYIYSIYIPKLYLGLISFLGSMRSHIFGTLVGVLSQRVPAICLGIFEGFVGMYRTPGMQTPTSSDSKLLETGRVGFWNLRPPKKRKQCGICCLNLFLLCTLLPIAMGFLKFETSCGGYTLTETNIFAPENRPGPKRIYASSKAPICSCYCLLLQKSQTSINILHHLGWC